MPSIGASIATLACTSARTSPVWIGDVVGLGRRQAGRVGAVDEQAPDVLERDPADELLDVDAAVAQRGALLVGLGDLRLERDDTFEAVLDLGHGRSSVDGTSREMARDGSLCTARRGLGVGTWTSSGLREEYGRGGLDLPDLAADPIEMFARWLRQAVAAGVHEPNAMVRRDRDAGGQAVEPDGAAQGRRPGRLRLLHQPRLAQGRRAARPTRTARCSSRGTRSSARCASRASRHRCRADEVEAYFRSRPRGAQLGAWASAQSRPVASRAALAAAYARVQERFGADDADGDVPGAARLGRLPGDARRSWSSGRAGPAGCTTGWSTAATATGGASERLAP